MGRSLVLALLLIAVTPLALAQTAEPAPAPAPGAAGNTDQPPPPSSGVATPATPAAAAPAPPAAAPQPAPQPARKRLYTWGSVGTTFAYGQTYGNVSVGAGLMMQRGLTPNVELSYNFGPSPTLWTLRPGVTWFLSLPFHPYVGAYYTHWFVSGRSDQNGVGGRAGLSLGRVISLAVTYDHALGCSHDCDIWTPQVSAGLTL
jgi:hypothetical protein